MVFIKQIHTNHSGISTVFQKNIFFFEGLLLALDETLADANKLIEQSYNDVKSSGINALDTIDVSI
jgi:hypothetical protein